MGHVRVAYLDEIEPHLYKGEYPVPPEFSLRQTKHGPIEVWRDLKIKVFWRTKSGKIKTGNWWAKRGMVLTVRHRPPSAWEKTEIQKPPEERDPNLQLPIIRIIDGRELVAIVERDKDLFSAARRFLKHITRSLTGKRSQRIRETPGTYDKTKEWIDMLYLALTERTRTLKIESPAWRKSLCLLSQTARALSKSRQLNLAEARTKIEQAQGDDRIVAIAEAIGFIGGYRRTVLAQIRGNAQKGLKVMAVIKQISQGVEVDYYKGIPALIRRLMPYAVGGKPITVRRLQMFAQQAINVYHRIMKVCGGFKPYVERTITPQVRRLEKAMEYVEKGDALGLYHALIRAHAKIEALILGERPMPEDIARARQSIRKLAE